MKEIYAEVITIGDEILYGQITDTNTQWLSAELSLLGIKTIRKSSVGDRYAEIQTILQEASQRVQLVILTGGLGPTNDDITKKVLSDFLSKPLVLNNDALTDVSYFFTSRGRELSDVNKQQAFIPQDAIVLRNQYGTAPGMWSEHEQTVFISLPGVPYEMKGIMKDHGLPALKKHFQTPFIQHQIIRTAGIGESVLAEQITDWEAALPAFISLAYLPSYGGVKLRLTGINEDQGLLQTSIQQEVEKLLPLLGDRHFYAAEDINLEVHIGNLLKVSGKTVSVAESCTGGYAQHLITSVPGSSAYFKGGIVSYSNTIKEQELGVPASLLEQKGAVSMEVAEAMAKGILHKYKTSYSLAITGIAGPDGGSSEKPVGFVCMAFASDSGQLFSKTFQFGKERDTNIKISAAIAMNLLRLGIEGKLS
ncbi:MAG: competence/damage-inducible protein CinA [Chitinophagaceae bacterium]|nr:competence/damage-inducible protein CinA [Chitinophagaceae bacterium]